jgi:hypothetical protein
LNGAWARSASVEGGGGGMDGATNATLGSAGPGSGADERLRFAQHGLAVELHDQVQAGDTVV